MTALTVEQLDAAPKGSRLIYRHGPVVMTRVRTLVGWVADDTEFPGASLSSTVALTGHLARHAESIRLIPPPAPVKVIGETAPFGRDWPTIPLHWRVECQVSGCDHASTNYDDPGLVHTMARTHARAHAEIGRAAA